MHDHSTHAHAPRSLKALIAVLALTTTVFAAELAAGIISGSLALLADAAHMVSDSAGLIVALVAMLIGRRAASSRATFGYRRVEVLAAAGNAGAVSVISVWIVVEAIQRFGHTDAIDTGVMLVVAVIGLVVNGISALVLARRQHDNLNLKGAYLHVLADMLGSVAVIIAGLIIRATGFYPADTIASIIIAALILPRSIGLLRQALRVLLEQVPAGVDLNRVRVRLEELPGVAAVHDLHVWSVDGTDVLASAHIVAAETSAETSAEIPAEAPDCSLLDSAVATLEGLGIKHATIQVETVSHAEHEQMSHE